MSMPFIVEAIMRFIDGATEPDKINKADALEVLGLVTDELQMRMEALRDEIRDAE